jgi:rhodanese-related sulfurtransferase
MSSINSISVEKLARLIGTPRCPDLVDVRTDEDFDRSPHLVPGSIRRNYRDVAEWAGPCGGRSAVVICQG